MAGKSGAAGSGDVGTYGVDISIDFSLKDSQAMINVIITSMFYGFLILHLLQRQLSPK